jgi:ketosteroid isomerase-like protein
MRVDVLKTSLCFLPFTLLTLALGVGTPVTRHDQSSPDVRAVAALDTEYQAAVKRNDAATMERILAEDFVLVTGSGRVVQKAELLAEARSARVQYEVQDDSDQIVRLWGDTAVVTAKLHEKGTDAGKAFDYVLWFSDTYVRTSSGWRYVFGQSSLPLPQPVK